MAHLLDDPYLKPFENAIRGRAANAYRRAGELTLGKSLADWAQAHTPAMKGCVFPIPAPSKPISAESRASKNPQIPFWKRSCWARG